MFEFSPVIKIKSSFFFGGVRVCRRADPLPHLQKVSVISVLKTNESL